jgi:hypothetical protein
VAESVGLVKSQYSDSFTAFTAGNARCTPHTWLVIDSTLQSTEACAYYSAAVTRAELSAKPAAVWLWAAGMACLLCSRRLRNCRLSDLPSAAVPPPQHSGSKRTTIVLMTALLLLLEVWALQHYLLRWLPDHKYTHSTDAAVQCSRGKQWVRWAVAAYSVCMLLYNGVPQLAIAACRCGTRLRPASQVLQSSDKWLTSPFGGESQLVYVELYRGAAISSTAEQLMELYSLQPHGVLTNAVTAAAAAKDYTAVRAILQVFELGDTRQCDVADATGANLSNTAKQQLQQRGATAGTGTVSRAAVWVQQRMLECLDMHDPTRSGFSSASAELLLTALSACLVASSGQYSQHAREAYMHSCTTTYKSGYKLIPNKAHLDEIHALVSGSSSADAAITALVSANSAVVSTATSSSSSSSSDSSSVSSSVAPHNGDASTNISCDKQSSSSSSSACTRNRSAAINSSSSSGSGSSSSSSSGGHNDSAGNGLAPLTAAQSDGTDSATVSASAIAAESTAAAQSLVEQANQMYAQINSISSDMRSTTAESQAIFDQIMACKADCDACSQQMLL